ncbi:uncharacterized protein LOC112085246 [Eutrema salsugineum]|uniref:uncharacterized protein LOC112085246 n=1 Tax=Eutrema salsugineum TaxID=72664 RepID=UPI000CED2222|nr:uncharacterized protein LOC112085246 [Eutrema salsugineum]
MTDPQKDVYPWILWFIWKAKNDKSFNGKEFFPEDTWLHAKVEAESWSIANQPEEDDVADIRKMVPPPPRISFPEDRQILIYRIDASWINHGPVSGLGWSLEDGRENEIFGLHGYRRSLSALHAEIVLFQTDCSDLMSILGSPADWSSFMTEEKSFRIL